VAQTVRLIQRKIHAPGHCGYPAEKFAVGKIPDASESVTQQVFDGTIKYGKFPEIYFSFAQEKDRHQNNSDDAAVIGHAADAGKPDAVGETKGKNISSG